MRCTGTVWDVLLMMSISMTIPSSVMADEWKLSADLDQGLEYDDNINMTADSTPVFGVLLRPDFIAEWNTGDREISLTGQADIRRYDDKRWDCDNFSIGLNQRYFNHRHQLFIPFEYAQNCTYSQQVSDTGLLVPNNNSEDFIISPSWIWDWSMRDQLELNVNYSFRRFYSTATNGIRGNTTRFRNNKTYRITLSEQHMWTRRLSSSLNVFFSSSQFNNPGGVVKQNVFGFQLGGSYAITRKWSVDGGAGLQWVKQPVSAGVAGDAQDHSALLRTEVANLGLSYREKRMDVSLTFSRTVSPSAFGQVLEFNELSIRVNHKFDRAYSFNINASIQQNKSPDQTQVQTTQNRTFYTFSPALVWQFSRDWKLTFGYRYRRQNFSGTGSIQLDSSRLATRESHSMMFHLRYDWDGLRVSH